MPFRPDGIQFILATSPLIDGDDRYWEVGDFHGWVQSVRRHIWLIATATAFFVLQAPLCVLACVESPTAEATAAEHSCHDFDESSNSSPEEVPRSHEGCGCELAPEAFVSQTSDSNIAWEHLHLSPALLWELNAAREGWAPAVTPNTDLPPPDILLLKSTLNI